MLHRSQKTLNFITFEFVHFVSERGEDLRLKAKSLHGTKSNLNDFTIKDFLFPMDEEEKKLHMINKEQKYVSCCLKTKKSFSTNS